MLTIQNQTSAGKIFKNTIFVGYGGVICFTGVAPKGFYTRLPCIKYKSPIYTAAVSHAKRFLYTAAVYPV